jgi:site-specific recombinase
VEIVVGVVNLCVALSFPMWKTLRCVHRSSNDDIA